MIETGKIWMNGKLVPFKDAKVHVLTHALHYSTSIFEGIRCYDTPNGLAIFIEYSFADLNNLSTCSGNLKIADPLGVS